MPNASEESTWTGDTRRVPATAIGGVRPRHAADAVPSQQQRRPFTSMGSSLFELDAARSSSPRATNQLQPVRSSQHPSEGTTTASEFNVRKFLLDQKGAEPLHTTALFRGSLAGGPTTAVGSSSKKRLPRMDHLMTSRHTNQLGLTTSSPSQPLEDPTVSHFYTIEKLSESCFHAVQSKHSKTWQFLPGAEERSKSCSGVSANASSGGANSLTNVERPSRRVDVLDLEKCFDLAMQFVYKTTTRSDMGTSTDPQRTTIERDVMTIQAQVVRRYTSSVGKRNDAADLPTTTTDHVEAIGSSHPSDGHKRLARTLFEQKWSDVVLGEIEAMLTKSFLEQGALLRKTRERYAKSFFKLERLYHHSNLELSAVREELHVTREELRLASATHELDSQLMKTQYEEEITRLSVGFETRRDEMEKKMAEAKDQMTKMGDTMKTLNTIFRQMREDTDKVKAVELRENYVKLEKKYEACKEEVERLRPLVVLNQQLHEQKDAVIQENRGLKDKMATFDPVIASKDEMIATLMEQQSELIAAQELQAAEDDERRKLDEARAAEEEEEEEDEDDVANESRRKPASQRVASAAVCVRCKENLRTQSQSGGLVTVASAMLGGNGHTDKSDVTIRDAAAPNGGLLEPRRKRVPCMYYRILLPNLRGRRPQRDLAWTLSCMRSIVFAKQLDDAMCKTSGGAFPLRIRMPEFVYSWFSPWRSLRDEKAVQNGEDADPEDADALAGDDGVENARRRAALSEADKERTEEQRQLQADEDRWCLYYGVKALVQEGYLEAKLFLSLLDEKYGEDEQVFMLYCYRVLDVLLGGKIQWGPFRDAVSYEQFNIQYEQEFGPARRSSSDLLKTIHGVGRVPKTIWISPYHASLATSVVLCKATEAERTALDTKLLAFAVTNLSAQERPTVYLTPTDASNVRPNADEIKLKRLAPHDEIGNKSDDPSDAPPLQFVDANLWIELMMMEYKEEQAHRRAAIRLMFQTATAVSSSSFGGGRGVLISASTMDMEQFRIMIRTLNDDLPSFMVATLFRSAFMRGNGAVTFESFLEAAECAQFFSSCMRLENPVASMARLVAESGRGGDPHGPSHAALSTSSRAAFVVDKYFTLMHTQLVAMTAALPIWTRSLVDALMYELSSALVDEHGSSSGGGALADGVQLLTSFHRMLTALLLSNLAKKDATGGVLSSKSIFSFEKAIQAVLDCVRVGDKTTVEQLIDAVRQNLSVKRVQSLFRKHIQRDMGAPLVMRPLFHPSYAKGHRGPLGDRQAERPLQWVLFVIADVLRRSLRFDSVQYLLLELSSVSSVLLQSGTRTSLTRDVDGGIGVSPKPLLVELLYDSFVERFGTRCEAEKVLHDVFVNCRSIMARADESHPLVEVFGYLCCLRYSNASPDDRLMGQNEALAFLQVVLRCGLHTFHLTHPPPGSLRVDDTPLSTPDDLISQTAAEGILLGAFSKLGTDQKQRMKMRLDEQLTIWKTPGLSSMPTQMFTGSFALKSDVDLTPKQFMTADAFLVLILHEWKRYIQLRMNELRVVCCSMEDEIAPFGASLPLDTIAIMLQKADVSFSNEELCAVFRRVCLTEHRENHGTPRTQKHTGAGTSYSMSKRKAASARDQQLRPVDHMSDRLAAACFPLLARETLVELRRLEHASPTPFKIQPAVDDKTKFLIESWRAYDAPCTLLLDELRRLGKNNDIQADAVSRRAPMSGGRAVKREVLYLSSSTSSDMLSSQDVAQLEALHALFLERLEKVTEDLSKTPSPPDATAANRRSSIKLMHDLASSNRRMSVQGSSSSVALLVLHEEAKEALVNSRALLVNETWKMFRQLLVMFSRLRSLAGLGDGPLPDKWAETAPPGVASAPASA